MATPAQWQTVETRTLEDGWIIKTCSHHPKSVFRCLFSYPQQLALAAIVRHMPLGSTLPSACTGTIEMPLVGNGIYGTGDKTSDTTTLRKRSLLQLEIPEELL
jgi:hypothetical protein